MKIIQIIVCLAVVALTLSAHGQDAFQNLNFEGATISQTQTPGEISVDDASSAIPGWNPYYIRLSTITHIEYNVNPTSYVGPQIDLVGANGPDVTSIEGWFSVLLQSGFVATPGGLDFFDASISQTGLVPTNAQSLRFKAQVGTDSLLLRFNGQSVPFTALANGSNYTLYEADISAFAGETVQLSFSALTDTPGQTGWNIDSIDFSSQPIPEPCIFAFCGMTLGLPGIGMFFKKLCIKPSC